jgi:multiple sugar transport system substrate-binding protein
MFYRRISGLAVAAMLMTGALSVAAQERVTITWFVGLGAGGQPEQIEAQNAVVEQFNASQDRITLEVQIVDNNVAGDTLSTLLASAAAGAGQAPDLVGPVGNDGSNAFAGNYLDLQPLVDASGYDLTQYPQAAVDSFRGEDGLVGLPFATFPSFIYYRRDLFDEAGLAYPPQEFDAPYVDADGNEMEWNMDTLRMLAMQLTVDANGADATMDDFDPEAIEQWGFVSQWNEPRGESTLFGGNTFVGADGGAVLPEAFSTGMNWYYNGIWTDHFIPNAAQVGSDILATGNAFSSGNVAMAHTHLWYTCCIGDAADWDLAVVPSYNGVYTSKLHGDTFRIMNTSAHPEEAFEVLTYLLGEGSSQLLQAYGGMPARPAEQEAFFAGLDERYTQGVNWQVAIDSLAYADTPTHEYNMPNYLKAKDRIGAFQTLYQSTPDLDINAEIATLISDLDAIFKE